MNRKQTVIAVLVTALFVFAIGATWVVATDGNVEYFACVNNSSGTIHLVSEGESCNYNEQLINWNQAGPQGPQGPQGPAGQSWNDAKIRYGYHGYWAYPGHSGHIVSCLSGETLLSAGYQFPYASITVRYSFPWNNTWYLGIDNPYDSNVWLTLYAACAQPSSFTTTAASESLENTLIVTEIAGEDLPVQIPEP